MDTTPPAVDDSPAPLVGPDHPLHDEGHEDPPGVSWGSVEPDELD